jgi:hypothetical protein
MESQALWDIAEGKPPSKRCQVAARGESRSEDGRGIKKNTDWPGGCLTIEIESPISPGRVSSAGLLFKMISDRLPRSAVPRNFLCETSLHQ